MRYPQPVEKFLRAESFINTLLVEQERAAIRQWRDEPGKDRAVLFGYCERYAPAPEFCTVLERVDGKPVAMTFRGSDALEAARRARESLGIS